MAEGRKRAKESARQSEAMYVTLVEHSNDGIIIIQNGLLVFVNRKMLELTYYSMADVMGKPFVDLYYSKVQTSRCQHIPDRMLGSPDRYQTELDAGKGRVLTVEINASLIEYEGQPATMAVVRYYRTNEIPALRDREAQLSFIHDKTLISSS
jgi:PAS domain S-box-containing protein